MGTIPASNTSTPALVNPAFMAETIKSADARESLAITARGRVPSATCSCPSTRAAACASSRASAGVIISFARPRTPSVPKSRSVTLLFYDARKFHLTILRRNRPRFGRQGRFLVIFLAGLLNKPTKSFIYWMTGKPSGSLPPSSSKTSVAERTIKGSQVPTTSRSFEV